MTDTDLPQKFEDAITETQVQDSQIITAQNQKVSVKVDLESMESNAGIAVSVTLNNAQAKAEAEMERNKAAMNSFENIIVSQANAYSALKTSLNMNNDQLITYIKQQAINNYNQNNMVLTLPSRA